MTVAMRKIFGGKMRQGGRYIFKVGYTNRQDDLPSEHCLAVLQNQSKSFRRSIEIDNHLILQLRHQALLESAAIRRKSFKPHGNSHVRVLNALLGAEPA